MKKFSKTNKNDTFRLWGAMDSLYANEPEKIKSLCEMINEKRFRVADTSLSYRQINYLDSTDILKDNRESEKEWRKFSLKEMIFFAVAKQLRQYGLSDEYLKKIGNGFFKKENSQLSDFAIIIALNGLHIIITQENNGDVYFYDTLADDYYNGKQSALLKINLNEIINDILEKIRGKRKDYETFSDFMKNLDVNDLNEKEKEIMELIRNKDYKTITIRKNNKEEFIVKGEKAELIKEKELMNMINEKDFADISIVKRDGNIVNIKVEDNFKI